MEETIPTDLSLRYTTTTYPELEESNYDRCPRVSEDVLIIACVCSCISLCGLVGNVGVVWLLGFRMKQNPFTVYVLNLAIADFLLLLILLAEFTFLLLSAVYCIDYGDFLLIDHSLFLLFLLGYFAGMYLLTAMSVEQCLAALFPVWYQCHRPKHSSAIMCGVLWTLPALFVALVFLLDPFGSVFGHILYVLCIVNFVLFSFIPLLSNLALYIKLRCGSQRRHLGKLYVAVLLSVLFVVLLGFPFSVESFLYHVYGRPFHISFLLASLNSSINPVIYFLLGSCRQHRFQCSLTVAFQRLFEEGAANEERSQVPGDAVMETCV
ncbi:proto-oncogene Mas-like [Melanerpes formicivorus]|uniref:proto-oncogene Mas-like n=1 Tax=Melanerpes formicivorus TaxID=211600 RepID=UPI00358F3A1E